MKRGAYGTSFHAGVEDIGIIGTNEEDMAAVANCLIEMGGGAAAANSGAGGGGARSTTTSGPFSGGAGGSGHVTIWEYT